MSQGSGFKLLPEKVLHRDIYIYPLNVMTPTQPAISKEVMERAVLDFNDKPMRFGEFGYSATAPTKESTLVPQNVKQQAERRMSRHITIDIEKASHIPRNVRVEDGWLMADIEVRPRTPCGQELFMLMGDAFPARTKPEDVKVPFIFTPRFYLPSAKTAANFLLPEAAIIITIDCVPNPYLKARHDPRVDS